MRNESLGDQIEQSIRDRDVSKPLIDDITRLEKEVKALREALVAPYKKAATLVRNMKGCGAVSTPADDFCEAKIIGIADAVEALATKEEE